MATTYIPVFDSVYHNPSDEFRCQLPRRPVELKRRARRLRKNLDEISQKPQFRLFVLLWVLRKIGPETHPRGAVTHCRIPGTVYSRVLRGRPRFRRESRLRGKNKTSPANLLALSGISSPRAGPSDNTSSQSFSGSALWRCKVQGKKYAGSSLHVAGCGSVRRWVWVRERG